MIDVDVITLEDGKNYIIFDTQIVNNNKYLFLSNENDQKDMKIRKVIDENGKEYLVKLDSEEEFDDVMKEFSKKYQKKEEE